VGSRWKGEPDRSWGNVEGTGCERWQGRDISSVNEYPMWYLVGTREASERVYCWGRGRGCGLSSVPGAIPWRMFVVGE